MGQKIEKYDSRIAAQGKNGAETIVDAEKIENQQSMFNFCDCNEKVCEASKRQNATEQMEDVVQQREQQHAQKIAKKRNRNVKASELFELLENQEYVCALSGVELTPENVSCDHIIALEKGGKHDVSNLQLVHRTVNRMKTTMRQEDFIGWCKLIADKNGS